MPIRAPRMCNLSDRFSRAHNAADGVMRWLEEFSARLLGDRYRIVAESGAGVPPTLSLSLFDAAPPRAAEAVSHPGPPACSARHSIPFSSAVKPAEAQRSESCRISSSQQANPAGCAQAAAAAPVPLPRLICSKVSLEAEYKEAEKYSTVQGSLRGVKNTWGVGSADYKRRSGDGEATICAGALTPRNRSGAGAAALFLCVLDPLLAAVGGRSEGGRHSKTHKICTGRCNRAQCVDIW